MEDPIEDRIEDPIEDRIEDQCYLSIKEPLNEQLCTHSAALLLSEPIGSDVVRPAVFDKDEKNAGNCHY